MNLFLDKIINFLHYVKNFNKFIRFVDSFKNTISILSPINSGLLVLQTDLVISTRDYSKI